ncbi:Flagellar hook-length control protein FliK [Olavius sp. associated proteobacterium Delta 1]|nr:Flagellar hook-length control protein FliK [Olavius sp. associated proteobacterium Delta 1]
MKPNALKTNPFRFLLLPAFSLMLLLPRLSQAADSLCAEVKIEIKQELTLERQAFDAHMRVNNGLSNITLDHVQIEVNFADEDGNPVIASFDPNVDPDATGARFFISVDSMENISDVDGQGMIDPSTSADIHWLIIPVPGAADARAQGKLYYVGATLTYDIGGEENVTEVTPDYIYVKPMPELALDYFIPTEVYGDDAFTVDTEPPVPFSLGLRVKNIGAGAARNLKIESAQPKIVENEQDLLIGFAIEGSEVNGRSATNSLLAELGDIAPDSSALVRWIMTCTLSGEFVSFGAAISHSDELGGELTSLIKLENVNTHFLVRDVVADLAGRDSIRDYLAKYGAGVKLFESEGQDSDVSDISASASLALQGSSGTERLYTLSAPPTAGFVYLKLPDPQGGGQLLKAVARSDGKQIKAANAWLSKSRKANPADGWNYYVNLFDVDSTASYTITYDDPGNMPQPPVMAFIPDRTGVEEDQISFLVEASDPNGTVPALAAVSMPVGAALTDQGDGSGIFAWLPSIGQAGTYSITFSASDGALEDFQRTVLSIYPQGDTDGDGMNDDWEMQHFGSLDRDGGGDYDEDGIPDFLEYLLGTDPDREDTPPSVPMLQSPPQGGELSSLAPELVIENSTDPDGDTLTYEFEIFADDTLTDTVVSETNVAEGPNFTTWTVPLELLDNTGYVWRARAFDGAAYSLWAYGSIFVNTLNDAPLLLQISRPEDGAEVASLTPVLEVSGSQDPDNDALAYAFEVYADSAMTTLVASASGIAVGADSLVSWTVDPALADDVDYYWRVVVADEHGAQTESSPVLFHTNIANHAPSAPTISWPLPGSESQTQTLDLVVVNATDDDGDTLTYYFEIDTLPTFDSPGRQVSGQAAEGDSTTSWPVPDLADNTRYHFRVKASDGTTDGPWAAGNFFVNTANDTPDQLILKNPGHLAWVTTLTPTLSVGGGMDPDQDGLTYYFEIYRDAEMTDLAYDGQSSAPQWTVPADLDDNHRYYWRVQAEDDQGLSGDWMETAAFYIRQAAEPDTISVALTTSGGTPLAGVRIYAFTDSDSYTGINLLTDTDGMARFNPADFSAGSYKFRADYLSRQFWSDPVILPGTFAVAMVIAEESTTVTVTAAAGPVENVKVYVFSDSGAYLGLNGTAAANGDVSFSLPSGFSYNFRADILGSRYWSGTSFVETGGSNQFAVVAGGGRFTATVQENETTPLQDIRVYLFHASGSYLNLNQLTDAAGQVAFDLPEGTYRVRADYLGYRFWSTDTLVAADTDIDLDIAHQDVTITVSGVYDQISEPLQNIPVYLFTAEGAYLNLNTPTDPDGEIVLHLPQQSYKVRADYLNQQFWSQAFTWLDTAVDISMADAQVSVGWGSSYLPDLPVFIFTAADAYLNLNGITDAAGSVLFRLPSASTYKFRADYQASRFWSNDTVLAAGQVNAVDISTGGGSFTFTVFKGVDDPLVGVNCHVFSEAGDYFGMFGPTSSEGEVSFDLAEGNYNIRVDYLGYQFWSPLYDVPATLEDILTIPHQDVTVTVNGIFDQTAEPLENIPVYLFAETGAYMNLDTATDIDGQVVFNLPDRAYKVRADYMDQEYWSSDFIQQDTQVDIPLADARITVTGGGQTLEGVPVYVYTASGAYLNLNHTTDFAGQAGFRLPAGSYKFRADYQSSEYWTEAEILQADQVNPVEISTGGGPFIFTVQKGLDSPLVGVSCYVFNEAGSYLNLNAVTSSEGQVSFDLADGRYQFRVDHLGYQFWSGVYDVPDSLSETFTISHQAVTLTASSVFQGVTAPLADVPLYLFTAAGFYLNLNPATDADGQVTFNLPDQAYKVRADYRNQQFWSPAFIQQDTTVDIPMADALVTVTGAGQALPGTTVYVYTGAGTYLNLNQATDAYGQAGFRLPVGPYKFRADYQGSQYWTDEIVLAADQTNAVDISTGGGAFALTVMENTIDPLAGARCYVFSEAGAYLGMSGTTDAGGQIVFNLADGNYKYRVDHLGYQFWTAVYTVPDTLADQFIIFHQDITITVESLYQTRERLAGVPVYLFTASGAYMSQNQITDADGQVVFSLPDQPYTVRADYLGYQFWSDVFQSTNTTVTLEHGLARIHAQRSGVDLAGARVYLYTGSGAYLNWYEDTDGLGAAEFLLPNRTYKFRVDENGDQVWSESVDILSGIENAVEIDLDQ